MFLALIFKGFFILKNNITKYEEENKDEKNQCSL